MKYGVSFDNEDLYEIWRDRIQQATGIRLMGEKIGRRIIVPVYNDLPDVGIELTKITADEAQARLGNVGVVAVKHPDEMVAPQEDLSGEIKAELKIKEATVASKKGKK